MTYIMGLNVAPATRLRYLSHVEQAFLRAHGPRSPQAEVAIRDLRDGLKRLQPDRPPRQAPPITPQEVRTIFAMEPLGLGLTAAIQYAAAARWGDLQAVDVNDITLTSPTTITLRLRKTKTSTTVGERTVACVVPTSVGRALRVKMREANHPLRGDYRKYLQLLKSLRPELSAHSIRRGAVQAAMRSVDDGAVMRLTGHTSVATLAKYAGTLPLSWRKEMEAASKAAWCDSWTPVARKTTTSSTSL